jgi:hypothetical protein
MGIRGEIMLSGERLLDMEVAGMAPKRVERLTRENNVGDHHTKTMRRPMYSIPVKLRLSINVRNQSVVPLHSTFNETRILMFESYHRKLRDHHGPSLLQPSAEMFRHPAAC